ncbi:hypothetical protein BT96DRAFT_993798 [Gymnopus androsaceus JB14]|uniref:Uncharacterized protein n=1 Tax=Gymnopus androsaceus JB14 TaxID=1447944 RepID=A0A6A4HNM9_9AGAR|nr:hypothetical protein BT96DRAFT_993798 [Gymnopus androsaceus JB14]
MILLAGFVLAFLHTWATLATDLVILKIGLVVTLPGGLMAQEMAADSESLIHVALPFQAWFGNLTLLVADAFIVWRAWAIWRENMIIKWILIILLLLDIGVSIADGILDTMGEANSTITLDWVSAVLNLAVNVAATLLIVYRAWKHHKSVQEISRRRKTRVEAILLIFIESGVIFGVIQTLSIIFQALEVHAILFSPVDIASVFISILFIYTAAINPVALVLLVQTGNTYEDTYHQEEIPEATEQLSLELTSAHAAVS